MERGATRTRSSNHFSPAVHEDTPQLRAPALPRHSDFSIAVSALSKSLYVLFSCTVMTSPFQIIIVYLDVPYLS